MDFLVAIKIRAENYLIYADECLLSEEQPRKYKIIFKKIPRDVKKFEKKPKWNFIASAIFLILAYNLVWHRQRD